jgi:hypothetical protein
MGRTKKPNTVLDTLQESIKQFDDTFDELMVLSEEDLTQDYTATKAACDEIAAHIARLNEQLTILRYREYSAQRIMKVRNAQHKG